jgi:hypothetical protein
LPWTLDGLSRTERRLLELARAAPIALRTVFDRVSEGETAFYIADLSFRHLVESLGATTPALIEVRAPFERDARHPPLLQGTISLTEMGGAVLDGIRDRVAVCGIDRWLGGVRLEGRGPVWRWDAETRRVVNR